MNRELDPALAWELACGGPFPDPEDLQGDDRHMALALRIAMTGVGLSSPNPPVGCLLVKEGRILGRGVHTRAGDPHGEIMALRDAESGDDPIRGATAYVTLEPCCHHGRTPPCTDALVRAGVARVVVGVRDPNPRVDGGGLTILKEQGVEVVEGVQGAACARFHAPFFKWIRTGLPWVSLKLALGSDASIGPTGRNTQVTPPDLQRLAHALRRASEAVLIGRRTAEVDDPLLTDRWAAPTLPHRVFRRIVLDSRGSLSPALRLWSGVEGQPALRVLAHAAPPIPGVEDLRVPSGAGGCSLRHLLHELGARGVGRLLVEGGPALLESFLAEGLADEFHRFTSPESAGGPAVHLSVTEEWPSRAMVFFRSHGWEILQKPVMAQPFL
jgi:diaminohydroxyphosphoribosylaminopyrimidine deaminase/5-amino-6-(5-phosphoribosylamino)uracil reductase